MGLGFGALAGLTGLNLGSSLINTAVDSYYNRKAASAQYGYEKSLMDYQNEWNLAQWNRENEYNSPKNIMARYQEAGLNPNLIYQNSYESPAHLESASGHAPNVKSLNSNFDLAAGILQLYNADLQNQLLREQINQTRVNTENAGDKGDYEEEKRQFERETGLDWNSTSGRVARFVNKMLGPSSSETFSERIARNKRELENGSFLNKIRNKKHSEVIRRNIDRAYIDSFYNHGRPTFSSGF